MEREWVNLIEIPRLSSDLNGMVVVLTESSTTHKQQLKTVVKAQVEQIKAVPK